MNSLEEGFIRRSLKPRVDCDIPGRLRLSFARYAMLPEAAKPYLHYVEDVLKLLPGVLEVRLNPRIGTILVLYTPGEVGARQILRWVGIVVDTGLEIARELPYVRTLHNVQLLNEENVALGNTVLLAAGHDDRMLHFPVAPAFLLQTRSKGVCVCKTYTAPSMRL